MLQVMDLLEFISSLMYADPPISLQNLKDIITATCNQLTEEQIKFQ